MRKILFHHIPKTAGTSLIESATKVFGGAVCSARYDYQITDEMIESADFIFYHGHFTRAVVERIRRLRPDTFVFTFVRHPFGRVLSQYYTWTDRTRVREELARVAERSEPTAHLKQLRQKFEDTIFDMSLEEFLDSDDPDISQVVNNIQSQYMTNIEAPEHVRFSKASYNAMISYDFVGLKELFVPCLRIVEAKCGLPEGTFGGAERKNVNDHVKSAGRYHVTARQLASLERRSVYDLALFHACHATLLKEYSAYLPPEAHDVELVTDLPRLFG